MLFGVVGTGAGGMGKTTAEIKTIATFCTVGNNWCEGADFDQSGTVDLADASIFFGNWLSGI